MSGAGALTAEEAARLYGHPEYLPNAGWEQYKTARRNGPRPLSTMGAAQREAFLAGAAWVIRTQQEWDTLPADDAIWELRRDTASIFYPLFKVDPRIWVSCPAETIHNAGARVLTDREGLCSNCGYDLVDGTHIAPEEN